jgi:hypothetical protein
MPFSKLNIYISNDDVPIPKLEKMHILHKLDNIKDFEDEILKNYDNNTAKLFIEKDKSYLIQDQFCFLIKYNSNDAKQEIINCAKESGCDGNRYIQD